MMDRILEAAIWFMKAFVVVPMVIFVGAILVIGALGLLVSLGLLVVALL